MPVLPISISLVLQLSSTIVESATLNSLNVPTHNRRYQLRVREQLQQVNSIIRDLCEYLSSVFTYMEQRYHIYPDHTLSFKGTAVNRQVCLIYNLRV